MGRCFYTGSGRWFIGKMMESLVKYVVSVADGKRRARSPRHARFWAVIAGMLLLVFHPSALVAEPESKLDSFKSFTAYPPVIRDIVFYVTLPQDRPMTNYVIFNGKKVKAEPNKPFWMHARWQKNGFYFRTLDGLTDLETTRFNNACCGVYDGLYWDFASTNTLILWKQSKTDSGPSAISQAVETRTSYLSEVLNMGLHGVGIGTMRWSGNHLEAEAVLERRMKVQGEVFPGADGRADRMMVSYSAPGELQYYVHRFEYSNEVSASFLPSKIYSSVVRNKQEIPIKVIQIHRLELDKALLSKSAFDSSNHVAAYKSLTMVEKGDSLYYTNQLGVLEYVTKLAGSPLSPLWRYRDVIRGVFLAVILIFNILIFILIKRMGNSEPINER
jgi:hypothetical protein